MLFNLILEQQGIIKRRKRRNSSPKLKQQQLHGEQRVRKPPWILASKLPQQRLTQQHRIIKHAKGNSHLQLHKQHRMGKHNILKQRIRNMALQRHKQQDIPQQHHQQHTPSIRLRMGPPPMAKLNKHVG